MPPAIWWLFGALLLVGIVLVTAQVCGFNDLDGD